MHEYALVQALLERVEREAVAYDAAAVHRLTVRIGPLAGVDRDLFAEAYRHCRPGTRCAAAELVLATEDVVWRCGACGSSIPAGEALVCGACGFPARLAGGDALVLERIELEVPSHV
jgi:hydrogenase nickel incorporation protein HypA/HybF